MDIPASALTHLGYANPVSGWPPASASPSSNVATEDIAAWFQGDAGGASIRLAQGQPEALDVGTLAQRVLAHLGA